MGRCGHGKTHQALREIRRELEQKSDDPIILLVPEQFTLQAEREVINRLGLPGIMRLEVLSPSRLGERILNEVGGRTRVLLSPQGRYMVLKKVISACEEQLTVYRQTCRQVGFIQQCSEVLAELKGSAVEIDALQSCAQNLPENALLKDKLHDIALIYGSFNSYLQDRYVDSEDHIRLVLERMHESHYLKKASIWIDNFTTFSPSTIQLIEQLMLNAPSVTISLTMPLGGDYRDREIFALSRYYYNRFHYQAVKHGVGEHLMAVSKDGDTCPELSHLERELYAYPHQTLAGKPAAIFITAVPSAQDEVEALAMKILSLVRQQHLRYRDIAVICSDISVYGGLIKRVFDEYRIPFFLDDKQGILHHPLVELLLSALDMLSKHYRREDVLRLIKTGLIPIEVRDSDRLENYALRYNIHGHGWLQPFVLGDEELCQEMERLRQIIIPPLQTVAARIKADSSWRGIARVWFEWLEDMHVPQTLGSWVEQLLAEERFGLASENSQIWNVLTEIFDQMAEILGDEDSGLREFRQVLEAGMAFSELGFIPSTVDQVMVGTATRSISQQCPVILVTGVNDGLLPRGNWSEGIFSGDEKDILQSGGVELGLDNELLAIEEDFLIYAALSQATQSLWLSYSLADSEGKALRPSLLIDRLRQLYPGLTVKIQTMDSAQADDHYFLAPDSSFKYLAENLRQALDGKKLSPRWAAAFNWFKAQPEWEFQVNRLNEALVFSNRPGQLEQKHCQQLFGALPNASVSRLELYAACPFAHFVRYGLRPLERQSFEVQAPDVGELFHQAILDFTVEMRDKGLGWQQLEMEQSYQIMDTVMENLLPVYGEGVFLSTCRYRYLGQRLKRVGQRAVWTLARHLQSGDFVPLGYEMRFGPGGAFPAVEVELANGETLLLEGRIDRVDVYRQGSQQYVRIIDYKSGPRDVDMSEIYYGLSLQLLIYLKAVLQGLKTPGVNNRPGGIFYFHIDDPLIESDQDVVAEIEKKLAAKLRLRGLVLEDAEVIRAMDRDIGGYSQVVPAGLNGDGSFNKNSAVLTLEQFEIILQHVENRVKYMSQGIMAGNIELTPYKKGNKKACSYCRYHPICHFDSLFAANRYRQLSAVDRDQLMQLIYSDAERRSLS
jgi:ATP-dependent helicase/nuclease subunit B